jgi:polyisoprenoid-binding protein YceI
MTPLRASLLSLLLAAGLPAAAAPYTVDAGHSTIGFSVTHMMVSQVRGAFTEVEGTVDFDPAKIQETRANATVKVASVNTFNAKRDDHLKGADFFDAAQFGTITFKSKAIKDVKSDGSFKMVGDLTIRGVTREVTLDCSAVSNEVKDPWGNLKRGFHASGKINRQDFGVKWNTTLDAGGYAVSDEVTLDLAIEMNKAK